MARRSLATRGRQGSPAAQVGHRRGSARPSDGEFGIPAHRFVDLPAQGAVVDGRGRERQPAVRQVLRPLGQSDDPLVGSLEGRKQRSRRMVDVSACHGDEERDGASMVRELDENGTVTFFDLSAKFFGSRQDSAKGRRPFDVRRHLYASASSCSTSAIDEVAMVFSMASRACWTW